MLALDGEHDIEEFCSVKTHAPTVQIIVNGHSCHELLQLLKDHGITNKRLLCYCFEYLVVCAADAADASRAVCVMSKLAKSDLSD